MVSGFCLVRCQEHGIADIWSNEFLETTLSGGSTQPEGYGCVQVYGNDWTFQLVQYPSTILNVENRFVFDSPMDGRKW